MPCWPPSGRPSARPCCGNWRSSCPLARSGRPRWRCSRHPFRPVDQASGPSRQAGRGLGRLAGLRGDRAAGVADARLCQVRRLFRPRARGPGAARTSGQERSRQTSPAGPSRSHLPLDGRGIPSGRPVRRSRSPRTAGPTRRRPARTNRAARLPPGPDRRQTRPDRSSAAASGKLLCHASPPPRAPNPTNCSPNCSAAPSRNRRRPNSDCESRLEKLLEADSRNTALLVVSWPDSTCGHSDSSRPSNDTSNCWSCSRRRKSTRPSRISTASKTARRSWSSCVESPWPKGPA